MKALLFDFGGTLDTNGVHWAEKFWDLYQQFNIVLTKEEFMCAYIFAERSLGEQSPLNGVSFRETVAKQLSLQFDALASSPAARVELQRNRIPEMALSCYDEVRVVTKRAQELLHILKATYKLSVVSNFYGNLTTVCEELGFDNIFDTLIDSAVVGVRKPDPHIFELALLRLGVDPRECTVIGASYDRDIVPAKRLGCKTIWLRVQCLVQSTDPRQADFIIHDLDEIVYCLKHK